jgi:hypothetical protein
VFAEARAGRQGCQHAGQRDRRAGPQGGGEGRRERGGVGGDVGPGEDVREQGDAEYAAQFADCAVDAGGHADVGRGAEPIALWDTVGMTRAMPAPDRISGVARKAIV